MGDPYGYILEGRELSPELTPNTLPSSSFSKIFLTEEMNKKIARFTEIATKEEVLCGEACYRHKRKRTTSQCEWNEIESSQFQRLLAVTGKNPCWIATCLGTKSCAEVWDRIEKVTGEYEEKLTPDKTKRQVERYHCRSETQETKKTNNQKRKK
eukprot:TRINITY_DN3620_c0_g1_i1.p1 TRINITY_DN3620_c0_g1~~TRINITY_DN3620_c0_g1_i1.p1  ORF type:complete len:154 (-),score=24.39 TRINITY_DN3620_c0_g1_i1:50-511(-)